VFADSRAPGAVVTEAAFRQHHEALERYLVRLTGDGELAADAAQEAFVRLLDQDPPPTEIRPWLFRVAVNVVRDVARKRERHRVLGMEGRAEGAHGDAPRSPDNAADRERARRKVRLALDALSEKERQALLMREEGFKHREIAEAVGTTTGSVGTLLRRALEKAARRLELEGEST
jgi:RNA polymerase sigma-70 factor (ECF subfamily)